MPVVLVEKDDLYVLNYCTKYLARDNTDERHNFLGRLPAGDPRGRIAETWRFPITDTYGGGANPAENYRYDSVTFVYYRIGEAPPAQVSVVGTFADLYAPVPLRRIEGTPYWTVSVRVPKGQVHLYKYLVDGEPAVDPVNPQRVVADSGQRWSRFFTNFCAQPIVLEGWELALLIRLTDHILPFRTELAQRFLRAFYDGPDRGAKLAEAPLLYLLDEPVGAANYIDKAIAREENHRLLDYRICLAEIAKVLRARYPYTTPELAPREAYEDLYAQMAGDFVDGWDRQRYESPRFFLQLLRRHTYTGAFAHPKYGGNSAASAWSYLEERYRDVTGRTLFDWRRAVEQPLGSDPLYRGIPAGQPPSQWEVTDDD